MEGEETASVFGVCISPRLRRPTDRPTKPTDPTNSDELIHSFLLLILLFICLLLDLDDHYSVLPSFRYIHACRRKNKKRDKTGTNTEKQENGKKQKKKQNNNNHKNKQTGRAEHELARVSPATSIAPARLHIYNFEAEDYLPSAFHARTPHARTPARPA